MSTEPIEGDWKPNPGPQTDFLSRTCFEALYGGAAGGGKSDALLVDAIRYVGKGYGSGYHAILFRRTHPELERTLVKRSRDLYPLFGARYNEQKKSWRFPRGEIVDFGHLEHENDANIYQGAEFQFVGFDELTHFLESQYLYLFSRVRSSRGVPCRIRAGTNPGHDGHEWVFKRWAPWLDPEHPVRAMPGQTLYIVRGADDQERVVEKGAALAKSRTFHSGETRGQPESILRRAIRVGPCGTRPGHARKAA